MRWKISTHFENARSCLSIIFSSFVIFFFFFNLNRREFEGKENLWNVVWEKAEEIDWSELKFWESVVTYFFLSASIRGRNASIRAASITRARSVNVRIFLYKVIQEIFELLFVDLVDQQWGEKNNYRKNHNKRRLLHKTIFKFRWNSVTLKNDCFSTVHVLRGILSAMQTIATSRNFPNKIPG